MSWFKKYDNGERSVTIIWHPVWNSKRNQGRQPADVDVDMDSHRNTDTKDPNSEELDELTWRGRTESLHQ